MRLRVALGLSLGLNVIALGGLLWFATNWGKLLQEYFIQPQRVRYETQFEAFPVRPGQIVFLGDSITAGGRFAEFFPQLEVRNQGIGGDTTADVVTRIGKVTKGSPARVFLKIGTNDLGFGMDPERTIERYEIILDRIASESPGTRVYIQSVLPRSADYEERVVALNGRIRELAASRGIPYIDLYPSFVCEDGSICDEYANDELHLTGDGYARWVELLYPYIYGTDY